MDGIPRTEEPGRRRLCPPGFAALRKREKVIVVDRQYDAALTLNTPPYRERFFSSLAQLCQNHLPFLRRFPILFYMPRPIDWTPLIPDALIQLRALTSQTVYRGTLERIFKIPRRTAIRLMHEVVRR